MADYYPLLSRAIDASPAATAEERALIYTKARAALERQLRGFEPPLAEETVAAELVALEGTIRRIEAEKSAPPTEESSLPQGGEDMPAQSEIASGPTSAPPGFGPASSVEAPPISEPENAPEPARSETSGGIIQPTLRPRVPERGRHRAGKGRALFAGVAIVAMLAMGLLALSRREAAPPSADDPRIVAAPQSPAAVPTDAGQQKSEAPKSDGRLASVEGKEPEATPQSPRPTVETAPTTSRAFMVLEGAGAAPNQFEGRTAWSFAPDPGANNQRSLKAVIAFPQVNLTIDITMARNADAALKASHTVMVIFESAGGIEPVREMSAIEWRDNESQTGVLFSGIVVPVKDNVFMLGLDAAESAVARNLDLLRTQKWMVFEVRLANGRRGAVLVEKGVVGERAIAEALPAWR